MTTNRSNYRVKVDLSKYHQDARRFSWIYVDCANVWFVRHVKQHIAEIFGTREPFHLLLNGKEYLPPIEDARVIKENEVIAVVPGTGISDQNDVSISISSPEKQETVVKLAEPERDPRNGDSHSEKSKMDVEQNDSKSLNNSVVDISAIDATMYHSMRDVTEMETTQDSKATDDNCSTNDVYSGSGQKRKRVRRKRSKNGAGDSSLPTERVDAKAATRPSKVFKPKPLQLPVLPAGKHIHFDNAEEKTTVEKTVENGASDSASENRKAKTFSRFQNPRVENLSTLLALRKCSTPLTFVNKKAKRASDEEPEETVKDNEEKESNDGAKAEPTIQDARPNNGPADAKADEEPKDFANVDPEKYPSLPVAPEINDTIAFKILRITNEYTPEVSDYIVAKTMDWCPKKSLFTFQILKGHTHIQTPMGKFSLPEDETEDQIRETANFNFSQLIEPRLIHRKK